MIGFYENNFRLRSGSVCCNGLYRLARECDTTGFCTWCRHVSIALWKRMSCSGMSPKWTLAGILFMRAGIHKIHSAARSDAPPFLLARCKKISKRYFPWPVRVVFDFGTRSRDSVFFHLHFCRQMTLSRDTVPNCPFCRRRIREEKRRPV